MRAQHRLKLLSENPLRCLQECREKRKIIIVYCAIESSSTGLHNSTKLIRNRIMKIYRQLKMKIKSICSITKKSTEKQKKSF
jgi:hypothetical protein